MFGVAHGVSSGRREETGQDEISCPAYFRQCLGAWPVRAGAIP